MSTSSARMRRALTFCSCLSLALLGGASAEASEPASAAAPGDGAPAAPATPPPAAPEPYKFQPGVICPLCELTPQFPLGKSGLHWHEHWRQAGVREYVTIPALAAAAIGVGLLMPAATRPGWNSPILFDEPVRDSLRIKSASGRQTASDISDGLFIWEVLHPAVLDPLVVAWWQRESPFVAWQMLVIDAQAYAFTFLVNDLVKRAAARQRPRASSEECAVNPDDEACTSSGRYRSFYSGHAAVTATGAGLLCAHHTQLNLYQNDWLDRGTCVLAVAGTALTGVMRIASDNHWASDVLVGHLMGYTSGYLLPTLLYYKQFRTHPDDHPVQTPVYAALPMVTTDTLGAIIIGAF